MRVAWVQFGGEKSAVHTVIKESFSCHTRATTLDFAFS